MARTLWPILVCSIGMKSASCLPRTWEFCTRWRRSSAVSSMARRRKGLLYQSLATQQRGAQRRCGGGGYGRDAAVKFPPAGQAATAASLRTDFTHTLRQSVRPSGSHARTHTLSQATSSAAAPFLHLHRCCLPPSPRLPAHSPRRRRPRQLFHSSPSLSPSYLRVAIPSPPASQPASVPFT